MLIPTEDRRKIHTHLFKAGVVVAKKDFNQAKHEEIDTKNLFVIKALQSLTSKGYAKTRFSWQYYYYTLTDEGVVYLRNWLNIPEEVVPDTHKKPSRSAAGGRPTREDRRSRQNEDYKRREPKEVPGAEVTPQFN
ncbi:40S ribosomal protein eS10 [Magnusiomyces paraingens]|uniref:Plectin/eS10 N-terminal domain-containing protein n=1 Tax=Magnusiomyces paraingens TaxID=2606893 RepID=A0A5E8B4Z3_9ASCO|nr:uncharacterized protein SAPINGB_P000948 [Saprochaete ingens]VVT45902.1 unnamed protein product [Saprochaete ingens]